MPTIRVLFLLALLSPALALAQAGRFLMAVGEVVVVRGPATIPAATGTPVHSGDTIRVGPSSNAQIRMSDESIVGLRSGTVFRIDEYAYSGQVDGSEKSLFSLLKGGMRTITGAIGKLQNKDKYAVRTPTSTVGIRGTHFVLVHCDNDCIAPPEKLSLAAAELAQADIGRPGIGEPVPNGTYGGVTDGRIGVVNNTGEREFGKDESFYVANQNTAPQSLIAPPSFLYDRLEGQSRSRGNKGRESSEAMARSGVNAEGRSSRVPTAPLPPAFVVTEQRTPSGQPTVVPTVPTIAVLGVVTNPADPFPGNQGGVYALPSNLVLSGSGLTEKLVGFTFPVGSDAAGSSDSSTGSAGIVVNETVTNALNAHWGRWTTGTVTGTGGTTTVLPTNQLHYLYGPLTPPEVVAAKTGFFTLTDTGFGTTPTNQSGSLGTFTVFPSGNINFSTRQVALNSFSISFAGETWSFSGATGIPIRIFPGRGASIEQNSMFGTCSGGAGPCNVSQSVKFGVTGIFMGPTGNHLGTSWNARGDIDRTAWLSFVRIFTCAPLC